MCHLAAFRRYNMPLKDEFDTIYLSEGREGRVGSGAESVEPNVRQILTGSTSTIITTYETGKWGEGIGARIFKRYVIWLH